MRPADEGGAARVPDKRLYYDEALIYLLDGRPFTGIGYEDVPEHGRSEITYLDGMQDGPSRDWYPSGQIKGETSYKENVVHGLSREWREDGTLISEEAYELGVLVQSNRFDKSGAIAESYELKEGDPNFDVLEQRRGECKGRSPGAQ